MAFLLFAAASPTWAGSIPTWLVFGLGIVVMWRVSRGGAGSAVTELSKANEVLTDQLKKTKEVADGQAQQIAALISKTDVVLAVTPLIAEHERMAAERHKATLDVLAQMAHALEGLSTSTNGVPKARAA